MSDDLDDLIRRMDPDRWLSSRFIGDAGRRADVIAIYAYDHELARAPKVASNPLLGEIRLTWWREMLDEAYEGRHVRHHPTAQALADVIKRHDLPREALEAMIDARYRELDATPMTADEALEWARGTGGEAARLSAQILDPGPRSDKAVSGGVIWALGRREPELVAGQAGVARADARTLSPAAFPAVAHAALALRPGGSEVRRRLRLTWAVARGKL
ncbi:squalene/phytoene synthase family protein [Phenylobacterium sp.]|uniref:squalene/phytoene synthase family protein n=1 Tax=Phenylobacterium sp. TaxID=1871053 RepID=UPI003D2CA5FC